MHAGFFISMWYILHSTTRNIWIPTATSFAVTAKKLAVKRTRHRKKYCNRRQVNCRKQPF
jgi:hypothetical protein